MTFRTALLQCSIYHERCSLFSKEDSMVDEEQLGPTPRKGGKKEEIQIHTSCQSFQNKISVHYIYNLAIYPGVKLLWSQIQRCDSIHSSIKRQIQVFLPGCPAHLVRIK